MAWLGVAAAAVAVVLTIVRFARRPESSTEALGTVSQRWIAQHRWP